MKPILILLFICICFIQDLYSDVKVEATSVINPNGTLNLHTGFTGSLDLSATQVRLDPEIGPVLSPTMLTPDWYPLGPGLNSSVYSIMILGNDVYAGGDFVDAGGDPDADKLARWDGCEWHAVGPGLNNTVWAIEFNGGNIYIGGDFTAPFDHIGYWDGIQWNGMGSGLNATVFTLASSGNDIYAGGQFTDAGGNANGDYIAQWNGSSWQNLGSGLNDIVTDIEISAGDVYVGGLFIDGGGNPDADAIARWDGTNWNNLGTAMEGILVNQIELDGSNVYVSGFFTINGGDPNTGNIVLWDGSDWHTLFPWIRIPASDMIFYEGNLIIAVGTSDNAWLFSYDPISHDWDGFPNNGFYTSINAFATNGIDLYAGGDFLYGPNYSGCPYCNIMRYGEPDDYLPLILDIPTEICDDDPPLSLPTTQSGYTGDWSGEGVNNNVFDPSGLDGEITLTFTPDPGQCVYPVDTFTTVIDCAIVVEKRPDILVPNIFTPNGDGVNDIMMLNSNSKIQIVKSLRIFDRWGGIIREQRNFLPNDPNYGWDGTLNGKLLNPGVFVWIAEVEFEGDTVKIFSGEVTLLR